MRIRIVGTALPGRECAASGDFPGYSNIHVGVQRKNRREELLDLQPGDAAMAVSTFDCVVDGTHVRGPYIQGSPGGRFIYLSWGTVDGAGRFTLFRRAKLMLEDVPTGVLGSTAKSGLLVGSLGLTDAKGNPFVRASAATADQLDRGVAFAVSGTTAVAVAPPGWSAHWRLGLVEELAADGAQLWVGIGNG